MESIYWIFSSVRQPFKDLRSLNTETGEYVDSLKIGSGAVVYADNKLYYYTQNGSLHLIKPNKGKLEQISSFEITKGTKEHFAHPVIHDGLLYQRHGNVMPVYDIK